MGYRSDVAYEILVPNEMAIEVLAHLRLTHDDPKNMKEAIEELRTYKVDMHPGKVIIRYHADHVKWYDNFPDVQALEAIFDEFEKRSESGGNCCGVFCRVGEESNDLEHKEFGEGWGWSSIQVIPQTLHVEEMDNIMTVHDFAEEQNEISRTNPETTAATS
jgi:hypothetical protein